MFSKILCCVDGSRHGLDAAKAAAELARRFDGSLTLLTVAKELKLTPEVKRYLQIEHISGEPQYVIDEFTQQIIDQAKEAAKAAGITALKTVVRSGHPARTIIEYARDRDFDCIVIGSRGMGDLEGVLLGSVSHKVTTLAPCTVVTVKT